MTDAEVPKAAPSAGRLVTIVIPAYNAAHHLPKVIPAALAAARGARVLVVDPGSSDETARVARELGAEVLSLGHRGGPALARNRGVELVDTELVLFIDSDCVAHPDVVERVEQAFQSDAELVTLTGSYDDRPPEPNFFSQYMNLRHHFTHQRARQLGAGFWAGCGAVRTKVFRQVGGFDAEQFPMPMIEDIELGLRMRKFGNTRLDPKLHVTHLKRWTGRGVIETDIFSRAIPWSRVILRTGELPNDLNLAWKQRISAALAPLALLSVPALPAAVLLGYGPIALAAAVVQVAAAALHTDLIRFFARTRGPIFGMQGFLFHQVHLTYSAATLAILTLQHLLRGSREVRPAGPPAAGG